LTEDEIRPESGAGEKRRNRMKRSAVLTIGAFAFVLMACGVAAYAQATFKIPFKFEAGGKTFPPGEYTVAQRGEGQVAIRQEAKGEEVLVFFTERLPQPKPAVAEPQIVFDMVGNFEPSYSEYITDYLLAEVWLPCQEGSLLHSREPARAKPQREPNRGSSPGRRS